MLSTHRTFINEHFDGDNTAWAWGAVTFLALRGVDVSTIHTRLSTAPAAQRDSGMTCEELMGDPEEWAEQQLATLTPEEAHRLRQPTRESWAGRCWYVSVTTLIWAVCILTLMMPVHPTSPLPGNAVIVAAAAACLVGMWGIALLGYHLEKYWSEPATFWGGIIPGAIALASVPIGLWRFAPDAQVWRDGPPQWVILVALACSAIGVWLLRGARRRNWPAGPVSDPQWRHRFRTIMVMQLFHAPAATTQYLHELTADAHESAAATGRAPTLNCLGTPEYVAAQFGPTEPPHYPWHTFAKDSLLTLLLIGLAIPFRQDDSATVMYVCGALAIGNAGMSVYTLRRELAAQSRRPASTNAAPDDAPDDGHDPWFTVAELFLEERHARRDAIADAIAAAKTRLHEVRLEQPDSKPEHVFGEPEQWAREQCDRWNSAGGVHVPIMTWQHPMGWLYNLARAGVYVPAAVAVVVTATNSWVAPVTSQFLGLLASGMVVFPLGCAVPQWLLPRLPRPLAVAVSTALAAGLVAFCTSIWFVLGQSQWLAALPAWLPPQGLVVVLIPLVAWRAREALRAHSEPPYDRLHPLTDAAWRRLARATCVHFCGVPSSQARAAVQAVTAATESGSLFEQRGHPVAWATTRFPATFPAARSTTVGLPLMGVWLSGGLAAIAWEQQLTGWELAFPGLALCVAVFLTIDELRASPTAISRRA